MKRRDIGILAGMGPRSTTPFLELVLDQCQLQYGAKYDIDYPHIMIYSLPTPFYIDREIDHIQMKSIITDGLRRLEAAGADFIAMPCNSAHVYYEDLKNSIDIPLLNIIDETVKCLPRERQPVTIFATETTVKSELYQKGIIAAGHEYVFQEHWQAQVNKIINAIKMKRTSEYVTPLWKELICEVKEQGIGSVILACTDLSILNKPADYELNIYDSSEALAISVIRRYLED